MFVRRSWGGDSQSQPEKQRDGQENESRPAVSHFASIIEFNQRAIELSVQLRVLPTMNFFALTVLVVPLVSVSAESLIPSAEGTTWNYELIQEKPSDSLDLTEPNQRQRLDVRYRLGGTEKIDSQELHRLEIYRGEVLESVDLIAVEEHGITCPARTDANGAVVKLTPPQTMLATPLTKGTRWRFDGMIGETKVNQNYEIAGEEDVDVPAGKFHAWRIHCDQISPAPATIDRWFVPGTGFVKVATVVKGASGIAAQKTWLKLKELPTVPPQKSTPAPSQKLSAVVSNQPKGEFKTQFKKDTATIYVRWHGRGLSEHATIRAVFIAENVVDVSADSQIDEMETTAPTANSGGSFELSRPEGGWGPGNYRLEFFLNDELVQTVKFKISK